MKRILLLIFLPLIMTTSSLLFLPSRTLAVDVISPACVNQPAGERPKICDDNQSTASTDNNPIFGPDGLITKGVQILTIIVGIAAVVVIIISGFNLVTSSGNSENVEKARRGLIYAVAGLIIAALAQIIVTFILNKV